MAKDMPLTSLHKKAYGQWSGNEKGKPAIGRCCCETVSGGTTGFDRFISRQCSKPRGFGPEGAYCKMHNPEEVAKRQAAAEEKAKKASSKWIKAYHSDEMFNIIKSISEGHNDPRSICKEFLNKAKIQ